MARTWPLPDSKSLAALRLSARAVGGWGEAHQKSPTCAGWRKLAVLGPHAKAKAEIAPPNAFFQGNRRRPTGIVASQGVGCVSLALIDLAIAHAPCKPLDSARPRRRVEAATDDHLVTTLVDCQGLVLGF